MKIGEMFEKPIDRDIKGVIKVGQTDNDNIFQELNEYVVTEELRKHFSDFFSAYSKSISTPTDDIGVWISGFFGSGKSHFLKILSYLLDSNLKIQDPNNPNIIRKPIDFFDEDKKIEDPMVIADMRKSSSVDTDVVLFNIDSKSSNSESAKDKILDVFVKVFNEMRGYCSEYPFLAHLEKELDDENKYSDFKSIFKSINGKDWVDVRDDYYFITDDIIKSVVQTGFMNEDVAKNWVEKAEDNYNISIEKFAKDVEAYCNKKGDNHHIVFLVDEVGQYIGEDTQLMLNLQSLTEDLGTKCHGKAWIIVTSQQNIDELVNVKGNDFSKIQGRFKTRLSLSSANVDEVIRKRILLKNKDSEEQLKSDYPSNESILKNIFTFKDSAEMKNYKNAEDFESIYPFVPYQFNLLQSVLTSIRQHGASGKHLAEGERSMLALFQESAINIMNEEEGVLVPFNKFYDALSQFIDHSHSSVIIKAGKNDRLTDFDVEVLKVLFLIKYVKEIKANIENITTLMISDVNVDKVILKEDVSKSLRRLVNETLVQKNGDIYSFLTNEEQDMNRDIKNEIIEEGDTLNRAAIIIYDDIFKSNRYSYNTHYSFTFNKSVDNFDYGRHNNDIGVRVISPYYEFQNLNTGQTTFSNDNSDLINNTCKALSDEKNEVILYLGSNIEIMDEIKEILQIEKYLRKNSSDMKAHLKVTKQEELQEKKLRVNINIEDLLKKSDIYVKGSKANIIEKNVESRLNEALKSLVNKVYYKLNYMGGFEPDKSDTLKTLEDSSQNTFSNEHPANNALNDLDDFVKRQSEIHNKPSLKEILNRFSSEPYGFVDLDIEWLVAKLFAQKRITLSKNADIISLNNTPVNTIFNFLTERKNSEKILLTIKEDVSPRYIKNTKDVYKEIFNETITSEDYDLIMEKFVEESKNEIKTIDKYLTKYYSTEAYPGKEILEEYKEILFEIVNQKSPNQFYKYIFNNAEDILDLNESFHNVIQFFNSKRKDYFDDAIKVCNIYESNKNYITNLEIKEIIDKINEILDSSNTLSRISELHNLTDEFNNKHEELINSEKIVPKNDIKTNYDAILLKIEDDEKLKEEFENQINKSFKDLIIKLDKSEEISVIHGISDEAYNLYKNYEDRISDYQRKKGPDVNTPTTPPAKKPSVNMDISKILLKSNIIIKDEDDLKEFISKISTKVKNELDNNKTVNLKL